MKENRTSLTSILILANLCQMFNTLSYTHEHMYVHGLLGLNDRKRNFKNKL